ncbi:hypothetical protein [Legionella longbeachae]|uniref:Uncharacterized protein n=1 Tax=Legionella longbeachae serogroup 1 (strain NSW150) TaxID=661367 RepID=D3HSV3_LEGLN|nr:hypothetical protein [Legionella longbeachae]VEE02485.1 Uncharacterised protein [Legionella oakridgensis]HBD7399457.1 hypothetical protein [Legionella pneumophila]ARB91242.1 hypothetical protein A6J40_03130 [Legionella longbeachae]EEZ94864.1 hypothetical protein LLB_0014 [Legionella longbeachae D-4968]QEY51593.1 hypothetical protein FQU71_10245 [Legionella longbeachae]
MPKRSKPQIDPAIYDQKDFELIKAQSTLFKASQEKVRDSFRRFFTSGSSDPYEPKKRGYAGEHADTELEQINNEVKAISRAVMRYPNDEVKEQLYRIHEKLKYQFAGRSVEGIEWLLGGASAMARGGFKNAQNFKNFLNTDPKKISPSRLITGIESVLTAIGYRMINADWAIAPFDPLNDPMSTEEQKLMQHTVIGLRDYVSAIKDFEDKHHLVDSINAVYKNRWFDDVGQATIYDAQDIIQNAVDVSEASEADQEDLLPQTPLPERKFQRYNDGTNLSWIGAADESNVPVRAHTSGTAPLTLAAMDAVLSSQGGPDYSHDTQDRDKLRTLAGALIIPTFLRGDFHSIAETYAGVEYYVEARSKKATGSTVTIQPIQPSDAFRGALKLMGNACTTDKVNGSAMPLQAAVKIVSEDVEQLIHDHDAQLTEQKRSKRI